MTHPTQLTMRALGSGILIGALLTPCNVYSGLKIGWSFNISIIALLLAAGFWGSLARLGFARPLATGEANITQTTASSSANIISGGLVAPIPALAILSGSNLAVAELIAWVFAVSFLGIWVAWYLRPQLILRAELPFPTGRATAETLREIYSTGRETALRLRVLLLTMIGAGLTKWFDSGAWSLPRPSLGFVLPAGGKLTGYSGITAKNLTFTLDPSLLLAGFGAIIGLRTGASLLLGAVLAWGVLGPIGLHAGFIPAGPNDPDSGWFGDMIEWLLWPGVALMVGAALTRFTLQAWDARHTARGSARPSADDGLSTARLGGLLIASALVVVAQTTLFDIPPLIATVAVPIAFLLAMVASRVVGETGIPPIGAIGKVSQLSTAVTAPGDVTANLMGANVAGGAAGQSADLLNDLKVGHLIGQAPQLQVVAQFFGIVTGSLVGSIVYLQLIPDPAALLMTEAWPAPAVVTWKAVAEALAGGLDSVPVSAAWAVLLAGSLGIGGAWLQQRKAPPWLPNLPAVGLAMVIPASISMTMFAGSAVAAVLVRYRRPLAERFLIAAASGLIAGESLVGVVRALLGIAAH